MRSQQEHSGHLLHEMDLEGIRHVYILQHHCSLFKSIIYRSLHERVIQLGLEIHAGVSTAYVLKGWQIARSDGRGTLSHGMQCAENGHFRKVLELYREMDTEPDASLEDLHEGKSVHSRLEKSGLAHMDHVVQNSLLNLYAKCGEFKLYGLKQVTAWNSLMMAYARIGHLHETADLYRTMCSTGVNPDGFTYATVVATFTELGNTCGCGFKWI